MRSIFCFVVVVSHMIERITYLLVIGLVWTLAVKAFGFSYWGTTLLFIAGPVGYALISYFRNFTAILDLAQPDPLGTMLSRIAAGIAYFDEKNFKTDFYVIFLWGGVTHLLLWQLDFQNMLGAAALALPVMIIPEIILSPISKKRTPLTPKTAAASPEPEEEIVRGHKTRELEELRNNQIWQDTSPLRKLPWGGLFFDPQAVDPHFAVLGIPGSGKTLNILALMTRALSPQTAETKPAKRAVIYDPKREFYGLLIGMGIPAEKIHVLDPYDARCTPWDVAADIVEPADVPQFASALVPRNKNDANSFFTDAARDLVREAVRALNQVAPGQWRLFDLVECCLRRSLLENLLQKTSSGKDIWDTLVVHAGERTSGSILASLRNEMVKFEIVADAWARSENAPVSLEEWSRGEPSILLLGAAPNRRESINPLYRALFRRVTNLVNSKPESRDDETWFFLDELRTADTLDGLSELLSFSRSKGGRVVIGFQDLDGLKAVYGKEEAQEIVGLCGNLALLRLRSAETAKWASESIGMYEYMQNTHSTSQGSSYSKSGASSSSGPTKSWNDGTSKSGSTSQQLASRKGVLEQEFLTMPGVSPENGVPGVFFSSPVGTWKGSIPWLTMLTLIPPEMSDGVAAGPGPRGETPALLPCLQEGVAQGDAPIAAPEATRALRRPNTRSTH